MTPAATIRAARWLDVLALGVSGALGIELILPQAWRFWQASVTDNVSPAVLAWSVAMVSACLLYAAVSPSGSASHTGGLSRYTPQSC